MWFQQPDAFTLVQFRPRLKWFERSDLYPSPMRFGEHLHPVFSGSDSWVTRCKLPHRPGLCASGVVFLWFSQITCLSEVLETVSMSTWSNPTWCQTRRIRRPRRCTTAPWRYKQHSYNSLFLPFSCTCFSMFSRNEWQRRR